jgi:hypothetical protein
MRIGSFKGYRAPPAASLLAGQHAVLDVFKLPVQLFPAGFQLADLLGKNRIFFAKTQDQCSIVVIGRIGHKRFDLYG